MVSLQLERVQTLQPRGFTAVTFAQAARSKRVCTTVRFLPTQCTGCEKELSLIMIFASDSCGLTFIKPWVWQASDP